MKLAPSEKERQWAMACHLSAFLGFIIVPIGAIIGPFSIWLLKRHFHPFINRAGKESLNFQISMLIWSLLSLGLIFIGIGIILIIALAALNVLMVIIAAVRASNGQDFHYPLSIRILR